MEIIDKAGGVEVSSAGAAKERHVSTFEQLNINVFWFANNFHWQALLAIVVPSMVVKFLGDTNKDLHLALVVAMGTLVAFFIHPLAGAISDVAPYRWGRRRPYLLLGTIFNVVGL